MIYILLPAYNEGKGIKILIEEIHREMKKQEEAFHILVIDDGSTDGTGDAAKEAGMDVTLEVIRHQANQGLGRAVQTGFRAARERGKENDIAIVMDADNTHPACYIPELAKKIREGYDLIIAGRFIKGAKEEGVPVLRFFLSRLSNSWYRLILPLKGVSDYTCGYRAYRIKLLNEAYDRFGDRFIEEDGFTCMFEILSKAKKLDARICQIPFRLRYDLKKDPSKMPVLHSIFRSFIRSLKVITR